MSSSAALRAEYFPAGPTTIAPAGGELSARAIAGRVERAPKRTHFISGEFAVDVNERRLYIYEMLALETCPLLPFPDVRGPQDRSVRRTAEVSRHLPVMSHCAKHVARRLHPIRRADDPPPR